jgi:hypothetical protein
MLGYRTRGALPAGIGRSAPQNPMHPHTPSVASRGTWSSILRCVSGAALLGSLALATDLNAQTWQGVDINAPSVAGSDSVSGGTITITAGGKGVGAIAKGDPQNYYSTVFGYADQFHFYATPIDDNTQIVARVVSVARSIVGSQAGVMIRSSFDASAENAFGVSTKVDGGFKVTFRAPPYTPSYMDHATRSTGVIFPGEPIWMKLVRSSGGVMTYTSSDGANWTEFSWQTIPFPDSAYAGLAVACGYDDGTTQTATFDNVSVGPVTPLAAPAAPTDLAVAATGLNYAKFTWTNRETHYERLELQRSTDGVTFSPVISWTSNIPSAATDESLGINTTYTFRVAVVRGTQTSYSNPVTVTTPALTLQVDSVWATRVNLQWSTLAQPSDHYIVEVSTDNSNFTARTSAPRDAASVAVDFLEPSTTYYFRVSGVGSSSVVSNAAQRSNVVSATTTTTAPPGSPAAPSNLRLTYFREGVDVHLAWDDNSDNEDGFEVDASTDGVTFYPLYALGKGRVSANTTETSSLNIAGYGKTGYWRVQAFNANGASLASAILPVTIDWIQSPSALGASTVTADRVELSWRDNSDNEDGFEVFRALAGTSTSVRIAKVAANATQYTDTTAAPGTRYFYTVHATSGVGVSFDSNSLEVTTPPASGVSGPHVVDVTFPAAGTFGGGKWADFQVKFSDVVYVSGEPRLDLGIGVESRAATFTSGTGTNTLVFRYYTQSDDEGTATVLSPIQTSGATIRDAAGHDADLTFAARATNLYFDEVNPQPPTIDSVTQTSTPAFAGHGEAGAKIIVVDVKLGGSGPTLTTQAAADGSWSANWTGAALSPGTYTFAAYAVDQAGNRSFYSNQVQVVVSADGTGGVGNEPQMTDAIRTTGRTYIPGDDIVFVANFDTPVVVTGSPYIAIRNGAQRAYYASGTGTTQLRFVYHAQASDAGAIFETPAQTIQANGGTLQSAEGVSASLVAPSVSGSVPPFQVLDPSLVANITGFTGPAAGTYGAGDKLQFVVDFSRSVTVSGTPAVQFTLGGVPHLANYVSGTGTHSLTFQYTVTASDSGSLVVDRDLSIAQGGIIEGDYYADVQGTPPDTSHVVIGSTAGGATPQTITFASPTGAIRVGQSITLGALSSAGLPITYAVVSGDATISGNVLTPTSTATLIVRASSPGDATYAAASTDVNFGNPIPVGNSRLVNISSRVRVSAGDADGATVAGFFVTGTTPKQILIRAAGPSLTQFGITNPVTAPQLKLYNDKQVVIASNAGWNNDASIAAAGKAVGAFALNANSTDSALLMTLAPGLYTAQVQSGNTGTALMEVYDVGSADPNPTKQLINISTRGYVGTDQDVLVAGFVVSGDAPKRILIRGVGPGITQFGVSNVVGDPMLKVYDAKQVVMAQNDNWEAPQTVGANDTPASAAQITAADTAAGAFPLAAGSTDSAVIVTLNPGQYTAIVSGANGGTGNAIVEVYELP